MHRTQSDHGILDLLSLIYTMWSRVFWPPIPWNVRKAQRWNKSVSDLRSLSLALRNLRLLLVVRIKLGSRLITDVDHTRSGNMWPKSYFVFSLTFDSLIPLAQALPHCCYCYCFFCSTTASTFFPYVCSPFPSPNTASFQASRSIHFGDALGSRDLKRMDRAE